MVVGDIVGDEVVGGINDLKTCPLIGDDNNKIKKYKNMILSPFSTKVLKICSKMVVKL